MAVIIDTRIFEGLRLHVYNDTTGHATIGYGHNLSGGLDKNLNQLGIDKPLLLDGSLDLTKDQAEALFELDMADAHADAVTLIPDLDSMPPLVISVMNDLSFNMGIGTLSTFKYMLQAVNAQAFDKAAFALQNSRWFTQVGGRGQADVNALNEAAN